jgi:hypothetical protein
MATELHKRPLARELKARDRDLEGHAMVTLIAAGFTRDEMSGALSPTSITRWLLPAPARKRHPPGIPRPMTRGYFRRSLHLIPDAFSAMG